MSDALQHAAAASDCEAIEERESMVVLRKATPPPAPRDYHRFGAVVRMPTLRVPAALADDGLTDFELLAQAQETDLRFGLALQEVRRTVEAERPSVPLRRRARP
jgi:hypothetical protein